MVSENEKYELMVRHYIKYTIKDYYNDMAKADENDDEEKITFIQGKIEALNELKGYLDIVEL